MRRGRNRKSNNVFYSDKKISIILLVVAIVIICACTIILILKKQDTNKKALLAEQQRQEEISKIFEESEEKNVTTENTTIGNTVQEENYIRPSKASIKIVGNILCENSILNDAYDSEKKIYDFSTMFSDIRDYIIDSDITIGNLETNFHDENYNSHNSPKSLIDTIKDLKIDTLNIANNQNLSDGVDGLISTKNALKEKGIDTYGTSVGENDSNILIKEVKGIKIAFLSYITKLDNGIVLTEENEKYINMYSEEKVDKDIEYVKNKGAEYIIVNIHTGSTQYRMSKEEQDVINNKLVASGADLIIGTHQNKLGKLEVKQNQDGKNVLIVNSLGNIISEESELGMILEVELIRSQKAGGTILNKVVYTPIYRIDNGKNAKDRYKVVNIRETIKTYENEDNTIVSKTVYNNLKNQLKNIENLIR